MHHRHPPQWASQAIVKTILVPQAIDIDVDSVFPAFSFLLLIEYFISFLKSFWRSLFRFSYCYLFLSRANFLGSANGMEQRDREKKPKTRWFLRKENFKITYTWQRRSWERCKRNEESFFFAYSGVLLSCAMCTFLNMYVFVHAHVCAYDDIIMISNWERVNVEKRNWMLLQTFGINIALTSTPH